MFNAFHEAIADISGTIRKHQERCGRPVIGVMPAYFPLELIHAAGGPAQQLPIIAHEHEKAALCAGRGYHLVHHCVQDDIKVERRIERL